MYEIGQHSDDPRFMHVSLDGDDLFDVQLYGDPDAPEADERRWYVESLAALEDLVSDANNGHEVR